MIPDSDTPTPRSLSELPVGSRGVLALHGLAPPDVAVVEAMGLTEASLVRVCRAGAPCIVEIHGARVGLSAALARTLEVRPLTGVPCPV